MLHDADPRDYDWSGPDCPTWAIDIGVDVDELIQDVATLERWREKLREWESEQKHRGGNLELVPMYRALTGCQAYASLAAVHDVACPNTTPIDPWVTDRNQKSRLFHALIPLVSRLTERDKRRLRDALELVRTECAAQGGEGKRGGDTPPGGGQGGRARSAYSASEPRGWIARLSENVAAQIIATVQGFVILAIAIWKWPWIKDFLG